MELWSSNKRREGGSGPAVEVLVVLLIVALVAIRKRIHVSVVEEAFGSISPGELLQGGTKQNPVSLLWASGSTATRLSGLTWGPWCGCAGGCMG